MMSQDMYYDKPLDESNPPPLYVFPSFVRPRLVVIFFKLTLLYFRLYLINID